LTGLLGLPSVAGRCSLGCTPGHGLLRRDTTRAVRGRSG